MDALKNFAYSLIATAPSPATSGTSLVVTSGQGAYFPATPFDATIWPSGVQPTNTNAEIVRVTNVSTDTFTITRAQYGTTAQSIAVGYQIAQTVDANLLNQLAPLSGATFTGNVTAPAHIASGLTGATAATRYVGGTTNGAPTSGTFAVGDFIVDQTATIWVCTTAGTPGTWWSTISNHAVLRTATATAGKNEVTIFSGSTASQTISAVASPVDGATWTFINQGTVNVTAGFTSNSMYPLGSSSSVTSYVIAPNSSYTFINYNGGNWYMTSTNDLDNGTGIVKVTNGGTGTATAPAVGSIPVATSTSAYTPLAIGANATVLTSNGTTATWAAPAGASVPPVYSPAVNGLKAWTFDPGAATLGVNTAQADSTTTYYFAVYLLAGTTYSTAWAPYLAGASGRTVTIGIYNSTTKLAVTGALSTTSTSSGVATGNFTSAYTPSVSGVYWIALKNSNSNTQWLTNTATSSTNSASINFPITSGTLNTLTARSSALGTVLPSPLSGTPGLISYVMLMGLS